MKIETETQAAYELDRLRDAWAKLSTVYEKNNPDEPPKAEISATLQNDLEQTCRNLSRDLLAWQGDYAEGERLLSKTEVRLEVREIGRRTGSGEPMHKPMMDLIRLEGVSEEDETTLPTEMLKRRSKFFIQGWNAAHAKSEFVSGDHERLRDSTNPYPDQSFRSAEFCGGWNEYFRRNS